MQIRKWRPRETEQPALVTQPVWTRAGMCSPMFASRAHADSQYEGFYLFRCQNILVDVLLKTWAATPAPRKLQCDSPEIDISPRLWQSQSVWFPAAMPT